jgi:Protein of unknown function (DUF2971)
MRVVPSLADLLLQTDAQSRQEAARFFISHSTFPRFFYKFNAGSQEAMEGFILNSTAYLASPRQFNDPFDLRAHLELQGNFSEQVRFLARSIRRRVPGAANQPRQATAQAAELVRTGQYMATLRGAFEQTADAFGVACFAAADPRNARTSGPRDILMWSHYAREHQGLCFQFHTRRSPGFFSQARKVSYEKDLVRINWSDRAGRGDKVFAALFQKAEVWRHENEFRIARPDRARTVERFKEQGLVGIVFGCRASDSVVDAVLDLCRSRYRAGGTTIRLYRCVQLPTSYGLRIDRARDLERRGVV